MTQKQYIPATPALRAEQVESWAFQAASWDYSNTRKEITSHFSAKGILNAVSEEEKAEILAAWDKGYKAGKRNY